MLEASNRPGFHTVTPYVMVVEPEPLVEFLCEAFEAEVTHRATGDRGGDHVELRIGDAAVMVGGGKGSVDQDVPASFLLYVDDVDDLHDRAVAAGATSMMGPADDLFQEDRGAAVVGPGGTRWFLARHDAGS